ncbi:tRNA (uracil(54)-C(5))-methyltransferase homolog, partial [Hyalella azteca]|uniref:tRNA (Uracil(54)-C(5))-methyltransferase homolog n=1 Tax=Hyalella azteca TaxID=294128 RepID=A0A8B7P6N4_HYAAZ
MTLLAAGVCQLCSSVRSVAFTAVRTVRKRAIRPVDSYASIPSDSSDPLTPPPSPSPAQHPQQTSLSQITSSSSQLTSSPSQITPSPSQITSSPSQLPSSPSHITHLSPRLPPSLPSHGQTIPKAVFGLTEAKLQELAASMPPVMTRRENVVEIQPPSPPDNRVVRKAIQTTEGNQHEVVADVYTPLWRKPYAEQLQHKETSASLVLKKLKDRIFNVYGLPLPEQLPLLPCPLHPIVAAPAEQGYRNEDTFTVWRGVDGNPKTVGLLTGDPKTAGTACVAPSSLLSVRKEHKLFCQLFEDHIRLSKHPSFIDFHEAPGVWRSVTVRSNDVGHIIACVHIFPHLLDEEDLPKIEDDLREYFCRGSGSATGLTSLYL